MSWDNIGDTVCPIARALSAVGDRWTLLILRELSMGTHRFDDLQALTGMSSQVLSARLRRLEEEGIVEKRRYTEAPPRSEYFTTPKGRDLDPVLLLLRSWGLKWGGYEPDDAPAVRLRYKPTGKDIGAVFAVGDFGNHFRFADVERKISPAFAEEREGRLADFVAYKEERRARRQG